MFVGTTTKTRGTTYTQKVAVLGVYGEGCFDSSDWNEVTTNAIVFPTVDPGV